MASLFGILIWALNLGISFWNAKVAGTCWAETKKAGGWPRFMVWMACVQSAVGFTWCYTLLVAIVAAQLHYLSAEQANLVMEMGYVLILPGILFSGLMIAVDSWIQAWRQKTLTNFGLAAYNTYAAAHNTYGAVQGIGPVIRDILKGLRPKSGSKSDKDGAMAIVLIAIALVCLLAGVFTTVGIVKHYAGSAQLPARKESGA